LLIAGKHPRHVQGLPEHASINVTFDTYSHVIEGIDGALADAMDETLWKATADVLLTPGFSGLTSVSGFPHRKAECARSSGDRAANF